MSEQDNRDRTVGAELAELRRKAEVTGAALAEQIGASQSKISRIENGSLRARPEDIIAIGRALTAPDRVIKDLVERATTQPQPFDRWRPAGLASRGQEDVGALESHAAEIRGLHVSVIPGLLQTADYAQALMSDYTKTVGDVSSLAPVPAAVTGRMRRQEILADNSKVFLFVLAETALLNRIAKPAALVGQVERIREASKAPNVLLRVLRSDTELRYPPLHDFSLLDARVAIIDTMTTTVVSRDPLDQRVYRRVFEAFWAQATSDIDPILDSYARLYAELAHASAASPAGPPTAADLVAPPAERGN